MAKEKTWQKKDRTKRRNSKMLMEYRKLADKEVNGKTLYRHTAILEILADLFWLEPDTIGKIIKTIQIEEPEPPTAEQCELFTS